MDNTISAETKADNMPREENMILKKLFTVLQSREMYSNNSSSGDLRKAFQTPLVQKTFVLNSLFLWTYVRLQFDVRIKPIGC